MSLLSVNELSSDSFIIRDDFFLFSEKKLIFVWLNFT